MKFSIEKANLLALVQRAVGVVDAKSSMPVLANILLVASGDTLTVRATDLYQAVEASAQANVSESGSVCIPGKDAFDRLKMMPAGDVIVSTDSKGAVTLKSATSPRRYRLYGLPGDSFPPIPAPDGTVRSFEVSASDLRKVIGRTVYAISTDETRVNLNGAHVVLDGESLRIEATDGHRLAFASLPLVAPSFDALLPLKGIAVLKRLLDEGGDAAVKVTFQGANASFGFAWGTMTCKMVDAQFPAAHQVIPQTTEHTATIPRAVAIEAIKAVSVASAERTGGIKFALSTGTLVISAESVEKGDGADEIPIDYDGAEVQMGFNARYILDALAVLEGDDVAFGFSGPLDPVIWHNVNDRDSVLNVIMPMRI